MSDSSAQPRVLVVDDDEALSRAIARQLTRGGYSVAAAHTIAGALELAISARPHAIVLDKHLGAEDGLALLPRVRDELGYLPPVVLCTGGDADPTEGIHAVIGKPYDSRELLTLLERLTRG